MIAMAASADANNDSVCLRPIPTSAPWNAYFLQVSSFPVPEGELPLVTSFLRGLGIALARLSKLNSMVFIQLEQLHLGDGFARFTQHAREWMPEVGLGVWVDRDPPAVWTGEDFMDLGPDEEPRVLMYQLFHITSSPEASLSARFLMLGHVVQIMTSDDTDSLLRRAASVLLPSIKDASFNCYPFYIPLLGRKTLLNATEDQLEEWSCGAAVYIRDSMEDQGVLIVSRNDLTSILQEIGGMFEQEPEPMWRIPI
jgi:hypothetical protein